MQDALVAADRLFEIIDLESEKGKEGRNKVDRFPEGDPFLAMCISLCPW